MSFPNRNIQDKFGKQFKCKDKMKEIFKSIIGIMFMTSLFLIFELIIQNDIPELAFLQPFLKGFVWVTLLMGFVIIFRSGYELITSKINDES